MENVILSGIFWTITYIVLIIYAKKYKKHAIPLSAMLLNFAWESVAMITLFVEHPFSTASIVNIAWFIFDLIMVLMFYFYETKIQNNVEEKVRFFISFLCSVAALAVLTRSGHMILSCFVIDLIMAILFVYNVLFDKLHKNVLIYLIAVCKLLGDLFAWLAYKHAPCINELGIMVLVLNVVYLILLVGKTSEEPAYYELTKKDEIEES